MKGNTRIWALFLAALAGLWPLLSGWSGSTHALSVLGFMPAEIARDLLGTGGSPLDGYDGIVTGPLLLALPIVPGMHLFGPVGFAIVLGTALVTAASVWLNYCLLKNWASGAAGLLAAALVAFPPPAFWHCRQAPAYHNLVTLLLPAALLLMGRPDTRAHRARGFLGGAVLGLAISSQLGNVELVLPILGLWWILRSLDRGRPEWVALLMLLGGVLLGTSPLIWKACAHAPWGGLAVGGELAGLVAVKPLALQVPPVLRWPARLLEMMVVDGPYGLHWELGGLPRVGPLWWWSSWGLWGFAAWRYRRDIRGILLVGPVAVLVVGLLTGWFVNRTGGDLSFSRDGRHLTGLSLALAWAAGIAGSGESGEGRHRRWTLSVRVIGWSLVGLGAIGMTRGVEWDRLGKESWRTPFRAQARWISGYFRAPFFLDAPRAGGRSCDVLPGAERLDCLRGLAMGFGSRGATAALEGQDLGWRLLEACKQLLPQGQPNHEALLLDTCAFGMGWGVSDTRRGDPAGAAGLCRADPTWRSGDVDHCLRGLGWALAQNHWAYVGRVGAIVGQAPTQDGLRLAEGVGVFLGMLSDDTSWVERTCRRDLQGDHVAACLRGAQWNERFHGVDGEIGTWP